MLLKHDVLREPLFRVVDVEGRAMRLSLPETLARLSSSERLAFSSLRPHQVAAWHAFLVQLACLALIAGDATALPKTDEAWRRLLRALTPDFPADEPWHLIVDDLGRPAFLQSPCSPGRVGDFKRSSESAQDVDLLVTARHHDEKSGKLPLRADDLDHLVYALISLQGWTPFLGAGNYNSMRMNGGFSSRSQFRLAFERGTGPEFRRDVAVLMAGLEGLGQAFGVRHGHDTEPVHNLLWLPPWDDDPLPLATVHPLALEVTRRVRLVERGGRLQLLRAASKSMRVDAKDQKGVVLDPWTPILVDGEPRALTAQAHSLGYRSLHGLLFDAQRCRLPMLAMPADAERDRPATLIAHVLVSGDGGTDGLLQREIPMPAEVTRRLADDRAMLARRARLFIERAGEMSGKVLRSALLQFVDGRRDVNWKNPDAERAVKRSLDDFEREVDAAFFPALFAGVQAQQDDAVAQQHWVERLRDLAERRFRRAVDDLPTRDDSRHFAQARAERVLYGGLRKHFGAFLAQARIGQATDALEGTI